MKRLANAYFSPVPTFRSLFPAQARILTEKNLIDGNYDALVIWGGEDIATSIYNEQPGSHTSSAYGLSRRDECEVTLAKLAIEMQIPIIGICRGAQMMCALSGGKVIQHVTGHAGRGHKIRISSGRDIWTNSLHHQMMLPNGIEHTVLAKAIPNLSKYYLGAGDKPLELPGFEEPEVIWIPGTKSLCIQGHPEFNTATDEFVSYCEDLVDSYICQKN